MKKIASIIALALAVAGCGVSSQTTSSQTTSSQKEPQKEVQIGYGSVAKDKVTTAVSHVDPEEDVTTASYSNIFDYIEGKVAGVSVEEVNGERALVVRGATDMSGELIPALVVVDGMSIDDPSLINPNEIASIDVLKDASATSIYGIRGAGGVIIITTKK